MSGNDSRPKLEFHVITLFPEMIESALSFGVVGQAIKSGALKLSTLTPRKFTSNVHQTVDDRPFGGGDGMIMLAEPVSMALDEILQKASKSNLESDSESNAGSASVVAPRTTKVIHLSPRGSVLTDQKARELAQESNLVLIASRYGGLDQRFLNAYVDEEISIGDYVLSGGEIAALVLIDSVSRHVPGVLGNDASSLEESFSPRSIGLEHPQYSRPRVWREVEVPEALLSGNHARIAEWKEMVGLLVTLDRRPELVSDDHPVLTLKFLGAARKFLEGMSDSDLKVLGLSQRDLILERLEVLSSKRKSK